MQGFAEPPPDEPQGLALAVPATVLVVAGLAVAAAFLQWRTPLPQGRYHFADDDFDAWQVAEALDLADRDLPRGCDALDRALEPWGEAGHQPLPAELSAWRATATRCAQDIADHRLVEGVPAEGEWTATRLLRSPLLLDEALRARLMKAAAAPAPPTDGELPPSVSKVAAVARVVRAHLSAIKRCYELSLRKAPALEGRVVVRFSIGADGRVAEVRDVSPTPFPSPDVPACIVRELKTLVFPSGVGPEEVEYPFVFSPAT